MDRLENIDELFRDELRDYAPTPPEKVWSRIEKDIAIGRKKVVIPAFLKIAASIVLIAGISWLVWRSINSSTKEQVLSETEQKNQIPEGSNNIATVSHEIIPETSSADVTTPSLTKNKNPVHVEVLMVETEDELAKKTEKSEEILVDHESSEPDNLMLPAASRTIILGSNADIPAYPYIKPIYTEIDPNDQIIQQNLLALENQIDNEKKKSMQWSIGGQAGPQYTYRDVYINTPTYPTDNYNKYESGLLAYAGGLQFEMEPTSRFSIQSGIYYSKIGQVKSSIQVNSNIGTTWYNSTPDILTEQPQRGSNTLPDVVNSTGTITFDKNLSPPVASIEEDIDWTVGELTTEQYFEFVEIPFLIKYLIIDKKVDVNLCTGLWANFLVGNKAMVTDNDNVVTEGKTNEINSFNYSGSVSIGVEYPIASNLNINLEPFFKYYLSPINTNPETDVYPYSMGVLTGIIYTF